VLSYEVRVAQLAGEAAVATPKIAPDVPQDVSARQDELERFFGHLEQTLTDIDFHKGRAPRIVMQRLRRLFLRAVPDPREVRILRGILTDAQRMARLARESGKA
jgi:tRNA (cytidine32/uridine32-2'-O)-methyltransferase